MDLFAKKFFGWIVALLLALSAYFQAFGASQLIGGTLFDADVTTVPPPKFNLASTNPPRVKSTAAAILKRNPFDSTTGPLDQKPIDLTPPKPVLDLSNPLAAGACDGIEAVIVTESTDPTWSLAALKGPGDQQPAMKRVGDKMGDREVAFIGYNPLQESPAVWLTTESSLCQALLFKSAAAAAAAAAAPTTVPAGPLPATTSALAPAPPPAAGTVPAEIASKIQKTSDTEYAIDRGTVDEILGDTTTLMRQTRIVPETKGGETLGLRLFGIRSDTLLGMLGLRNGDRLDEINGFKMGSPEQALQAYAGVRAASALTVKINRGGKPMTLDYAFK